MSMRVGTTHTPSIPRKRWSAVAESREWYALIIAVALFVMTGSALAASPHVEIEGLMPPNAAVLNIDGERKLLKLGRTVDGITLVAVYSRTATLEIDGKHSVLGLSQRVGANYQPVIEKSIDIRRNANMQYRTTAYINGRKAEVMVDTGANIIAMNSTEAMRLGIRPDQGRPVAMETASDKIAGRHVNLRSVDVGGIRIDSVDAVVVEGDYPRVTLLGMSFLKHVKIKEEQGVMTLSSTY